MQRNILSLILFLTIAAGGPAETLLASDYTLPVIRIEAEVTEEGTVRISEHRTYQFSGSFSWADYTLPKEGFSEIRDIRVSGDGHEFINKNSEEPGTFSVSDNRNSVTIKWHYQAADESRTFTISYELTDALSTGPAYSEFFWNYLPSGRDKRTETFEAMITFPVELSADELHIWTRGSEQAAVTRTESGYIVSAENIPRNESVRVRTLFPSSLLSRAEFAVNAPLLTPERAAAEEELHAQKLVEQAERAEFYESVTRPVTILICVLSIAIFILLYRKYGRRHNTKTISDQQTVMIPDAHPPAIIGQLLNSSQPSAHHLIATLFDLARRGRFVIREEEKEKSLFSSGKPDFRIEPAGVQLPPELNDWEQDLADFAERRIAGGKETLTELFNGSDTEVYKWYAAWKKKIIKAFNEQNWIDRKSYIGVGLNIGMQLPLMAAAIFLLVTGKNEIAIAGIILTGLMVIASAAIMRRTPEGQETFRRWRAYREGLKNADRRTMPLEMLDRHFIYATAFGLSKNQISMLIEANGTPVNMDNGILFPWIILMPGSIHSPASLASSVSALAASGSSSFSGSGISSGTGASAGISGGGASGGAG